MNKDWFNEVLRQKLPDAATDADLEAVWDALGARRKKRRRRRAFIWWVSAGVLALVLSLCGWLWTIKEKESGEINLAQKYTPAHVQPAPESQKGRAISPHRAEAPARYAATNRPSSSDYRPALKPSGLSKGIKKSTDSGSRNEQPDLTKTYSARQAAPADSWSQPELAAFPPGSVSRANDVAPDIEQISCLPGVFPNELIAQKRSIVWPNAGSPEKRKRRRRAEWGVGASGFYGFQRVSRSGAQAYVQQRNEEETPLDLWQFGLEIRRQVFGVWYIQSGLQYAQSTDVRKRTREETSTRPEDNLLLRQIVYADGSVEETYGTADVTVVRTIREERYNQYRRMEIPVLAGLVWPSRSRWQFDAATGMAAGIYSWDSGRIQEGLSDIDLSTTDSPLRRAGTISALGRVGCWYRQNAWALGLGIQGRIDLTNTATPGASFTEKRRALGVGFMACRVF